MDPQDAAPVGSIPETSTCHNGIDTSQDADCRSALGRPWFTEPARKRSRGRALPCSGDAYVRFHPPVPFRGLGDSCQCTSPTGPYQPHPCLINDA